MTSTKQCCICKGEATTKIKKAENKNYIGKPICSKCEEYRQLLKTEPSGEGVVTKVKRK